MSWQDARAARSAMEFFRLKEDGDHAAIIIAGEPTAVRRPGMKGGETTRYYLPVIVKGERKTWDMNGKTFDLLAALPEGGYGECFVVTRHGKVGDSSTTYTVVSKPMSEADKTRLAQSGLMKADVAGPYAGNDFGGDDTIPF